eukprot:maker-scaffold230_size244653-snap-gene-0.17 protein:Tk08245 transcript:maker-scaffold230_size244653-snap-gene-0.17-mRNA-1 annotation:"hypothetical protein PHYSODRAFT_346654"
MKFYDIDIHDLVMGLDAQTVDILKTTAPVLKENGTKVTSTMYRIMFSEHPEVKNLFNMSHHLPKEDEQPSPQARSLANAVYAYAENCDNLGVLSEAVERIAHKHVSLQILPEHYPIVGECILKAIKEVLGDAATEEIMTGWTKGYQFLADIFIDVETKLRAERAAADGGWEGYKPMKVVKKKVESEEITSFYLEDPQGGRILDFKPGQYLSFQFPKGTLTGWDHDIVRNYSISTKPGQPFYRISIKREVGEDAKKPAGLVSNHFHDEINAGDEVLTGVPCGNFVLNTSSDKPVVLIGAGVGLTPMVAMLECLVENSPERKVTFIQSVRTLGLHAMRKHLDQVTGANDQVDSYVFYTREEVSAEQAELEHFNIKSGRVNQAALEDMVENKDCEVYFCGPDGFLTSMKKLAKAIGVPEDQIFFEYFGPTHLNELTVDAVAMETWRAFHSQDGPDGSRNALDQVLFPQRRYEVDQVGGSGGIGIDQDYAGGT